MVGRKGRDFSKRRRGGTRDHFRRGGCAVKSFGRGKGTYGRANVAQLPHAAAVQAHAVRKEGDYDLHITSSQ